MDLMNMAAQMLSERLGIDPGDAMKGLSGLFDGSDGGFDIGSLIGLLQQGGLGDAVSSWLGDGRNISVDTASIQSSLGADRIADAANGMGVSPESLSSGLAEIIPDLIDQVSSGGSLLGSVGGLGGMADIAKKLF